MSEISEFHQAMKDAFAGLSETADAFFADAGIDPDSIEDENTFMYIFTMGARDFIAYLVDGTETLFIEKLLAKIDELTAAKGQANGS